MPSIIFIALILVNLFSATSSINSVSLNSGRVCALDSDPNSIKLRSDESSSILVTEDRFFARWTGRYNFRCKFTVKAKDDRINDGIYAVIQKLSFRKNDTTGQCIDYVEFSIPSNLGLLRPKQTFAKRYCGTLHSVFSTSEESEAFDFNTIASNAYKAKGNELSVEIYIAGQRQSFNEEIQLTIAFTAFKKDCYKEKRGLRQCRPGECIWEGFFNDGIQNCPYASCPDEKSCLHVLDPFYGNPIEDPSVSFDGSSRQSGFELTISAIASTFFLFLLFAGCLCVCKRSRCLCWAPTVPRPPPTPPIRIEQEGERVLPSAPLEPETKDMPPSYESLFPATSS